MAPAACAVGASSLWWNGVENDMSSIFTVLAAGLAVSVGGAASGQCGSKAASNDHGTHKVVQASYKHAPADIIDTAIGAGNFKTLAAALEAAGLVEALKGKGPYTVFAPSDEAFAKLPEGTVATLLKPENKARLASILKYHVLSGEVLAKDVKTMPATTLDGQRVDIKVEKGTVKVDGATVVKTDIRASNGVIHVIDMVILPSEKDIVTTAVDAGKFTTLAMLIEKAGLVETLKGAGPFTVFAPTDEAFAKLPKATLETLLKPESKEALAKILTYHVLTGRVFSDVAAKGAVVPTVQGTEITTKSDGGKVKVNNATVLTADLDASNGVIHVIDTVLIPK